MEEQFGEDWEMQMGDEDWEMSDEIQFAFSNLYEDGWYSFDDRQIVVIKEVSVD
jgi:hypothetical protein